MKFNALVVAAMVITSASAGGRKGSRGLTHDPPLIDFDSDLSQNRPVNDFGPVAAQETLLIDLVSEYPQGPSKNVPRLELSQIPQVRGSGSGFPHNLMDDDLGPFQESDHTNKESSDDSGGDGIGEDLASYSNGAHVEGKSGDSSDRVSYRKGLDADRGLGGHGGQGYAKGLDADRRRGDGERQGAAKGLDADRIIIDVFDRVHFKSSPECTPFILELHRLWKKAMDITYDAESQVITLRDPSIRKKTALAKRVNKKSPLYIQCTTKLKILKKERKALEANYRRVWHDLKEKGCWIDALERMCPEKMIDYRPFPKF
ncbi:hypothetical protein BASA61_003975 [Batrachochytrium salamandrivorans]|nr:hypothetical protein BASA61_003975 [Batrachochytrium salamandrivorans]